MMIAGAIIIISAIFVKGIVSTIIMLASLLISISIMMIYAYIVYRDERRKESEGTNKE
jgi:heme/copper-type cytochrome/quinol oxidase subunit 2